MNGINEIILSCICTESEVILIGNNEPVDKIKNKNKRQGIIWSRC